MKRYNIDYWFDFADSGLEVDEDPQGEWVKYSDLPKQEVCKWEYNRNIKGIDTMCGSFIDTEKDVNGMDCIRDFKYCPYCGKQIELED